MLVIKLLPQSASGAAKPRLPGDARNMPAEFVKNLNIGWMVPKHRVMLNEDSKTECSRQNGRNQTQAWLIRYRATKLLIMQQTAVNQTILPSYMRGRSFDNLQDGNVKRFNVAKTWGLSLSHG